MTRKSELNKAWRLRNKERANEYARNWAKQNRTSVLNYKLKRDFGITIDQYESMLSEQNGVCAICHKTDPHGRRLAVDHNHETGQIRGLLCTPCNLMIGNAREDESILLSGVAYLKSYQSK